MMERIEVGRFYVLRDDMSSTTARVLVVDLETQPRGHEIAYLDVRDLDSKPGNVYAGVSKVAVTQRHEERLSGFAKFPITVNVRTIVLADSKAAFSMLGELYRDGPLDAEPVRDIGWFDAQIRPGCLKTAIFMVKLLWKSRR